MPVCFYFSLRATALQFHYMPRTCTGESIVGGDIGPVLSGDTGWKFTIQGFWPRDHGDGHHPLSGSDRAAHAAEGVPFGWDSFAIRHFARDLLRCAERRQCDQHELRHQNELRGDAESPRLCQAAGRDLRGVGWERWPGSTVAGLSSGAAKRCDGSGFHERPGYAFFVLQLWERHRVGRCSGRIHCDHLPVQHVCGGMGNLVQCAIRFGGGRAVAQLTGGH